MKFNEKLTKLRKEAGLSQEELGNMLNVARQTISKWELGETTPEMDKLIKMSEVFNITLDELIKDEKSEQEMVNTNASSNSNSQKLADIIIKILKGIGIILIILVIVNVLLAIVGSISFNKMNNNIETTVMETQLEEYE